MAWLALTWAVLVLTLAALAMPLVAQSTWYVRTDGGTRYNTGQPEGQCDGLADAAYPGHGKNQHCAFNDYRLLWQDGSYAIPSSAFPALGWVVKGGDTIVIHAGHFHTGWENPTSAVIDAPRQIYRGLAGDPYGTPPPLPSGTPEHPTRMQGDVDAAGNPVSQLVGTYGQNSVLNVRGTSYFSLTDLDLTDGGSCGLAGQTRACQRSPPMSNYASNGLLLSNATTHGNVRNVRAHGFAANGFAGPTGDDMHFERIRINGNGSSGWNTDLGDGTTGAGRLWVHDFAIDWNGCMEQKAADNPAGAALALPYSDCTDDGVNGGYGDGFGTATVTGAVAWNVVFEDGEATYNTQDGLDALHLIGAGSSMTVRHVRAYGNMGQQLKVGGALGNMTGNLVVTNCNALRERIPGTAAGYNARLSDFCRAADEGIALSVSNNSTTVFENNTVISASATGMDVVVSGNCTDDSCRIRQRGNIFVSYRNDRAHGYVKGGSGELSNPVYTTDGARAYRSPGSSFSGNITYFTGPDRSCPIESLHETAAHCGDPHLVDESWHAYGIGDMATTAATSFAPTAPTGTATPRAQGRRHALSALRSHPARAAAVALAVVMGTGTLTLLRGRRA